MNCKLVTLHYYEEERRAFHATCGMSAAVHATGITSTSKERRVSPGEARPLSAEQPLTLHSAAACGQQSAAGLSLQGHAGNTPTTCSEGGLPSSCAHSETQHFYSGQVESHHRHTGPPFPGMTSEFDWYRVLHGYTFSPKQNCKTNTQTPPKKGKADFIYRKGIFQQLLLLTTDPHALVPATPTHVHSLVHLIRGSVSGLQPILNYLFSITTQLGSCSQPYLEPKPPVTFHYLRSAPPPANTGHC